MTPYDQMMKACLAGLNEGERRQLSVDLLRRIVGLCADTVPDLGEEQAAPSLLYIKAWSLRVGEPVWQPETETFAVVQATSTDAVGLMCVGYGDDITRWYSSDDVVQIPAHRALAERWNARQRRSFGATPVTS